MLANLRPIASLGQSVRGAVFLQVDNWRFPYSHHALTIRETLMRQIFSTLDNVGDEILHNLSNHHRGDVVLVSTALVATFVAFVFLVIHTITAVAT
jgi:hypothetical protein